MLFCYAGLMFVGVIFGVCLWQSGVQWFKAEKAQLDWKNLVHDEDRRKNGNALQTVERDSRAYALACLIAAGVAAAVELIAGGIVYACGG